MVSVAVAEEVAVVAEVVVVGDAQFSDASENCAELRRKLRGGRRTCSSVIVSAALIHRFLSEYWKSMSSKRATFPMISPHARFVPLSSSSARIAEAYMWK